MPSTSTPVQGQLCRRIAFIHAVSGEHLFPVAMKSRSSGRVSWCVSPGGTGGNLRAVAKEVFDEEELVRLIEVQGWSVRTRTEDRRRTGLYSPHGRNVARVVRFTP